MLTAIAVDDMGVGPLDNYLGSRVVEFYCCASTSATVCTGKQRFSMTGVCVQLTVGSIRCSTSACIKSTLYDLASHNLLGRNKRHKTFSVQSLAPDLR